MRSDDETSSSSSSHDDEEGWEDAEPEEQEDLKVVSLFDDRVFPDVQSMIQHCKDTNDFDFVATQKQFNLDFYQCIKLVNYIRSEVKAGRKPDFSSTDNWVADKYLQPVLEDDALLFSLDDLIAAEEPVSKSKASSNEAASLESSDLEARLQALQAEFASYKRNVEETLDKRWNEPGPTGTQAGSSRTQGNAADSKDTAIDDGYFESYSYNEIHEVMLKDTVRTDAYRDFIYDNKHLFAGKTVLDVGCGTGILSMFCAKAGAARVIAVDNSDIIDRARVNIQKNGLDGVITCLRGKIEEVNLPVQKVDIIVSEWMGYCLLFEAMLDSVLWARDKYLVEGGLMVPSHTVMHIAPFADPDFINDNFDFWLDVYGFDMTAMMEKIYDDVLVQQPSAKQLCGQSYPFGPLSLHTVTKDDLSFTKEFSVKVEGSIENLDGWVIWFDTFFLTGHDKQLPADARAEEWRRGDDGVAFTTAPLGKETHWRSGVLIADRKRSPPKALHHGAEIKGTVTYRKGSANPRALDIEVEWSDGSEKTKKQTWYLK